MRSEVEVAVHPGSLRACGRHVTYTVCACMRSGFSVIGNFLYFTGSGGEGGRGGGISNRSEESGVI